MKVLTLILALALLTGLPAQARRRVRTVQSPAHVEAGFSPTTPFGTNTWANTAPASSGFSPTTPFNDAPKLMLNTSTVGRQRARGYGRYRYSSRYMGNSSSGSTLPGYDKTPAEKAPPGYDL